MAKVAASRSVNGTSGVNNVNSVFVCCAKASCDGGCPEAAPVLEALGQYAEVWPCCWYLETALSASEIKAKLTPLLDGTDSLMIIDATNHEAAWQNIQVGAAELIRERWHNGALRSPRPGPLPRSN